MIKVPFAKHILRWLVNNQTNFYRFSIFLHMYNLAWLFATNLDSSSGQACLECPSTGIMNACMCLRNKYYGVTQSRYSVRLNCGKLKINVHAWQKVVLCHKFLRTLRRGQDQISSLFYLSCYVLYAWEQDCAQHLPFQNLTPLHSTPLHSNTPLHNSNP